MNLRLPRDSVQTLRELPIVTPAGAQIPLAQVAEVVITDGRRHDHRAAAEPVRDPGDLSAVKAAGAA